MDSKRMSDSVETSAAKPVAAESHAAIVALVMGNCDASA